VVTRGEIWWVAFDEPAGSEARFDRPAVVVSSDRLNASTIATVTVVPLYSNLKHAVYPGNVALRGADCGLDRDSIANVSQVTTVDRTFAIRRIGAVSPSLMRQIDDGLRLALHL
jgi:mRNA interferase MazF